MNELRSGSVRAAVYQFVRTHPACTFTDIWRGTGLAAAQVRYAITDLACISSPPALTWTGRGVDRRFRVGRFDIPVVSKSQARKYRKRLIAPANGDTLTREGATSLAETIAAYWAARGRKVTPRVVMQPDGVYVVRSDVLAQNPLSWRVQTE